MGATRSVAPFSSHSICHGTMFEWCSMAVISTSSPAPHVRAAVGLRHQVDGLGRAAHKDDLAGSGRVDELLHRLARPLRTPRSRSCESVMHAAMDVGVVVLVIAHDRVDHRVRLLRGGRVVEIDQRRAVDLRVQDREVARICSTSSVVCPRFTASSGAATLALIPLPPTFSRVLGSGAVTLRRACLQRTASVRGSAVST